jgi:quercetin dioxygenase-like cupin family protein
MAELIAEGKPVASPPLHSHDFDETFYVMQGELIFRVRDECFRVTAGQLAFAPRGVPHTYANHSDPLAALCVSSACRGS